MGRFALGISLLLSTVSFVLGQAPSAGACGPTSVPNVPGKPLSLRLLGKDVFAERISS